MGLPLLVRTGQVHGISGTYQSCHAHQRRGYSKREPGWFPGCSLEKINVQTRGTIECHLFRLSKGLCAGRLFLEVTVEFGVWGKKRLSEVEQWRCSPFLAAGAVCCEQPVVLTSAGQFLRRPTSPLHLRCEPLLSALRFPSSSAPT